MEALAAVALAGNVLEFTKTGSEIIKKAREGYKNGDLKKLGDLRQTTEDLSELLAKLKIPQTTSATPQISEGLQNRVEECCRIGQELHAALIKLQGKNQRGSLFRSTKNAIKAVWSASEFTELQVRLDQARQGLDLHLTVEQRLLLEQLIASRHSTDEKIDALARQLGSSNLLNDPADTLNLGLQLGQAVLLDQDFIVERKNDLEQVEKRLQDDGTISHGKIITLHGLGGVGKTQIAIQYALRHRDMYTSILWLDATSAASLQQSLAQVINSVKELSGDAKGDTQMEELVRQARIWLSKETNKDWLLLADNYGGMPSPSDPDDSSTFDLLKFLPQRMHGNVIVTCRTAQPTIGSNLYVQPLIDEKLALQILLKRADHVEANSSAIKLAKRLAGLPLALATAGAYIRSSGCSFEEYLDTYQQSWHELSDVSSTLPEYGSDTENHSLFTTWNISHKLLAVKSPTALRMLQLLAFFDPGDLWFELFSSKANDIPDWLKDITISKLQFHKHMGILKEYAFLEVLRDNASYRMHPCVHDWIVAMSTKPSDTLMLKLSSNLLISAARSDDEPLYVEVNLRLIRHVLHFNNQLKEHLAAGGTLVGFPDILSKLRFILDVQDLWQPALELCHMLHEWASEQEEVDIKFLVYTMSGLGAALYNAGQLEAAKNIYIAAEEWAESNMEAEDDERLAILANLAVIRTSLGEFDAAYKVLSHVFEIRSRLLGPDAPATLKTSLNLAGILYRIGKSDLALSQATAATAGLEKLLGRIHWLTLKAYKKMASILNDRGQPADAETYARIALQGMQAMYGKESPATLPFAFVLADTLFSQEKSQKAKEIYIGSLDILSGLSKQTYAKDIVYCLYSLAGIHIKEREYEVAEQMLDTVRSGIWSDWRNNKSFSSQLHQRFAKLYLEQGHLDKAVEFLKLCLIDIETVYNKGGKVRWQILLDLSKTLTRLNKDEEALECAKQALEHHLWLHRGGEILEAAEIWHEMAVVLMNMQRYEDSMVILRLLVKDGTTPGIEQPEWVPTALINLAKTLYRLGEDPQEALQFYQKALQVTTQKLGGGHPKTRSTLVELGQFYWEAYQDLESAERYLKVAIEIKHNQEGIYDEADYQSAAGLQYILGIMYGASGKHQEAEEYFLKALRETFVIQSSPDYSSNPAKTKSNAKDQRHAILGLGAVYMATGKDEKAAWLWKALNDHNTFLTAVQQLCTPTTAEEAPLRGGEEG